MSHRSKSGQKRNTLIAKQRIKRRNKRKRAALIASGVIKKGQGAVPAAS